jgi:hypothetical protein
MLVKFRANRVGLVADIEKAFLMVGISNKDGRDQQQRSRYATFFVVQEH